jgi:subtilisin family serine protease
MADQVDVNAMHRAFKALRASKAERHYQVVTALQRKANDTQGPIMQYLAGQVSTGEIEDVESRWIVNMVYAHATKRTILELAKRTDVGMIYDDGLLVLDAPVDSSPASQSTPGSAEPNLRAINAHLLWDLGITGEGTLVMNIDTGVNGAHPALSERWRGNQPGVNWYHAWFDQMTTPSPVPVDYGGTKHGSHTMGIMTGVDTTTRDTIGVAPRARWIASPTIDVGFSPHTTYTLNAFQWAADPDSNVNTSDDVPDVISNSYQDPNVSGTECNGASGYWAVVDALEAIGTAVVWSAGNAGPGASTITPPKNRITSNVNFFAAGNLNTSTAPPWVISSSSSRGPSDCDNLTIKPEVCAPGTSIRSSLAGSTYGNLSGTSMASPHVAGAIALLRSANPAMTGTELKETLLNTAVDYGTPGEDNTYGNGLIDLWAAYLTVSVANPRIEGTVTRAGTGDTLAGVIVENLTTGSSMQTQAGGFYRFVLPDTGTYRIRFTKLGFASRTDTVLAPDDSTTYPHDVQLTATPEPAVGVTPPSMTFNLIQGDSATSTLTVGNSGPPSSQLAYSLSINGGLGGLREDTIGTAAAAFSGGARYRGNVYRVTDRTTLKEIKSYHAVSAPTEFRFAVYQSTTQTGTYTRIFDGLPDTSGTGTGFVSSGPISVQLDSGMYYMIGAGWLGSVTYYNGAPIPKPVGFGSALCGASVSSYPPPANASITSTTTTFYFGAVTTTSGKFISLNPGIGDTLLGGNSNNHSVRILTTYLEPSGSPYSAEILVSSNDTSSPAVYVPVTLNLTSTAISEESAEGVAGTFALEQNYPNPFNPSTTIGYRVQDRGFVSLKVHDVLGREIATLVNEQKPPGTYEVTWNSGALSSGVYYYRLLAGGQVVTRKMMLLK